MAPCVGLSGTGAPIHNLLKTLGDEKGAENTFRDLLQSRRVRIRQFDERFGVLPSFVFPYLGFVLFLYFRVWGLSSLIFLYLGFCPLFYYLICPLVFCIWLYEYHIYIYITLI